MDRLIRLGAGAALFASLGGAVAAPEETVSETRLVDARVLRVKVDGPIDLKLKQGAVAALVFIGSRALMARASADQQGDTLHIGAEAKNFHFGRRSSGLRAELTLPDLREVSSDSLGTTEVTGFSGDEIDLKLDGAGAMKVVCNYRLVNAVLGGVGSMQITGVNMEGVDLNLNGAGFMTLRGTSKWLKANMGGLGNLDAQHFHTDSVNLDLSGLGNATVSARQNVTLNLSGMGSVTVYGKPAKRSVSVDGLGSVSWK